MASFRFTKKEQNDLEKKCIEINKALIKANQMPVRVSELAHIILEETIKYTTVDKSGKITVRTKQEST